jgi:hypothetical protein
MNAIFIEVMPYSEVSLRRASGACASSPRAFTYCVLKIINYILYMKNVCGKKSMVNIGFSNHLLITICRISCFEINLLKF